MIVIHVKVPFCQVLKEVKYVLKIWSSIPVIRQHMGFVFTFLVLVCCFYRVTVNFRWSSNISIHPFDSVLISVICNASNNCCFHSGEWSNYFSMQIHILVMWWQQWSMQDLQIFLEQSFNSILGKSIAK